MDTRHVDANRPALVFVHGSGGSGLHWNYQTTYFRARGYRVVALDLPGHGRAPGPGLTSIEGYADYVEGVLAREGIERAVIGGHSLGGAIVLAVALRGNPRCVGLVLVGTGARLRVRPDLLSALRDNPQRAYDMIVDRAYRAPLEGAARQRALAQLGAVDPRVIYGDYFACDGFDVMDGLDTIDVPVLIVVGRDDQLTPVKYAEYMRDRLPHATLDVIEDAGHMVMVEQPGRFNAALAWFLETEFPS